MIKRDIIVIGGGAAGFFAAINIAKNQPNLNITILERGKEVLTKVKVSGGGRCNVTHAEFIPSELVNNYPRGAKELLGPFHHFMTGDTIAWFEERGIELKIEEDGRMFPISDSSQTIIDCFINEAKKYNVEILKGKSVREINKKNSVWEVITDNDSFKAKKLVVTTGSNTKIWKILENLGHTIVSPVPSLFTFNIQDKRISSLPGISVNNVQVSILGSQLKSEGPLLITHWGMSGPAILKLSAFGARFLAKCHYNFQVHVNFIGLSQFECQERLITIKQEFSKKTVSNSAQFGLPKRLWQNLIDSVRINFTTKWADINKTQLINLSNQLTKALFQVTGKSTFKEEFVTSGGVDLKEVNFKTFESKLHKGLYFAGEVLNIDAVTGGFNFQNAWTGAYIISQNIIK